MKKVSKTNLKIHSKKIIIRESKRGWAITIIPDNIRIDNFYKDTHMHLKPEGIHIPSKYKGMEEVGLVLVLHIIRNKKINLNELKEEIIWYK